MEYCIVLQFCRLSVDYVLFRPGAICFPYTFFGFRVPVPVVMPSLASKETCSFVGHSQGRFLFYKLSRYESCQSVRKGDVVRSSNGCDSSLLLEVEEKFQV
ncbi:hypothetical protein AVEN_112288-1 [Araneus ventricosus]|uniref:Uncharacterized protein n=1 Tax=Araneus ventricosus TaxID=182803 RepID=A0A4Y2P2Z4_ARAVE|nr:hypothetical protein AVEN_112288-1 [Araneus ventricosus]